MDYHVSCSLIDIVIVRVRVIVTQYEAKSESMYCCFYLKILVLLLNLLFFLFVCFIYLVGHCFAEMYFVICMCVFFCFVDAFYLCCVCFTLGDITCSFLNCSILLSRCFYLAIMYVCLLFCFVVMS